MKTKLYQLYHAFHLYGVRDLHFDGGRCNLKQAWYNAGLFARERIGLEREAKKQLKV